MVYQSIFRRTLFTLSCLIFLAPLPNSHGELVLDHSPKLVVGWIEKVQILPQNIMLHAKVDTGADTSSLNVSNLEEIVLKSERWVTFQVTTREGQTITLKKPVRRYVRIKRKGAESQRRPVVQLDLCLGNIFEHNTQVNLANRKNFKYNMLIGRNFLKRHAVVDSAQTYKHEPNCAEE
ncbi:MAG: ATP-dependent zinc protease [Nitrospirales bacterium]